MAKALKVVEDKDGSYSLSFDDFSPTAEVFEDEGYDGGGYGWHGVADALIRMRAPELKGEISFNSEASLFSAKSSSRQALAELSELMSEAIERPALLREAIEKADPDLMD